MRAYTFTHAYLSDIQHGIQAAHALVDMQLKYDPNSDPHKTYINWAKDHKTMICLNGGNSANLQHLYYVLSRLSLHLSLPISRFTEDEQSMQSMTTAVAIIVPERIYQAKKDVDDDNYVYIDSTNNKKTILIDKEIELFEVLKSYRLV